MRRGARPANGADTRSARLLGLVLLGCTAGLLASESAGPYAYGPQDIIGYRGNGTGVFQADPPVAWDEASGKGIAWKTEMPAWSDGQPIVVGDKVFCTSEPHDLICLDRRSGQVLWCHANDPLELWPKAEAEAARAKWQRVLDDFREATVLLLEERMLDASKADPERLARTRQEIAEKGYRTYDGGGKASRAGSRYTHRSNPYDTETPAGKQREQEILAIREECMHKYGLVMEQWDGYLGHTYAAPVSDGTRVYVSFGWGQVVCYDLDGKRLWMHSFPGRLSEVAGAGDRPADRSQEPRIKMGRMKASAYPSVHFTMSPTITDGVLIVQAGQMIRGLDRTTGRPLWEAPTDGYAKWFVGSPVATTVGGRPVVVTAYGAIYSPKDGRLLCSDLPKSGGPVVVQDDVAYINSPVHRGEFVTALRLTWSGNAIVHEELWRDDQHGAASQGALVHAGLFHALGKQLSYDAATGSVATERARSKKAPREGLPGCFIAADRLYTIDSRQTMAVYSLPDRQLLGINTLETSKLQLAREQGSLTREQIEWIIDRWFMQPPTKDQCFWHASPFVDGKNIYLRTHEHLYCIGPKPR